jgi:hypothetical protein
LIVFLIVFLIVLWIILVLETQVRGRRNHCSLAAGRRTYSPGSICDCELRDKSSGGLKGNLQCESYLIPCANPYVALFAVDILYIFRDCFVGVDPPVFQPCTMEWNIFVQLYANMEYLKLL